MSTTIRRRRGSYKIGIVLAACLVGVLAIITLVFLLKDRFVTDPDPSGKYNTLPITMPGNLDSLIAMPTGPGDGAVDADRAIMAYMRKAEEIAKGRQTGNIESGAADLDQRITDAETKVLQTSEAVTLPISCSADLLASADKKDFNIEPYLPKGVEWNPPSKFVEGIEFAGRATMVEGEIAAKAGNKDRALQLYRAVMIYANRWANTHVRVQYQLIGMQLLNECADRFAPMTGTTQLPPVVDGEKAQAAAQYSRAGQAAWLKANDKSGALFRHMNKWHPGDVLLMAKSHPDRAWRVDAILTIGLTKYSKAGFPYAKSWDKWLDKFSKDPDPYISAAAVWARDLNRETFRQQGGQ